MSGLDQNTSNAPAFAPPSRLEKTQKDREKREQAHEYQSNETARIGYS